MSASNAFDEVLAVRGTADIAADEVTFHGEDPVLPTRFRIAENCAGVVGAIGCAVNDIWALRGGKRQQIQVNVRHAGAALNSSRLMQRPGNDGVYRRVVNAEHEHMISVTQPWPTKDGRYFLPHFGLPNLRDRVLGVLGCKLEEDAVRNAVATWDALELEAAIDEARACGAMVRTNGEWLASEHGQVLAAKPLVEIIKIGDSDPVPFAPGDRPLSGVRALDLTRILAGPIAARTLAENGADVLMVTSDGLPQIKEHVIDTSHGKRSTFLDLKSADGKDTLRNLVKDTDVFSQGYRPSTMANLGFAPEDLASLRPGLIYVSISCFGADGPFSHRAGWEQVAQTVTGICHDNGDDHPRLLPGAACDYTTGYLGAYGALLALAQRAREGGSYHVRVSLCQSGMFIYRQGLLAGETEGTGINDAEFETMSQQSDTVHGPLRYLKPILQLSETPTRWDRPTPQLGGDQPQWQ